MKRIYSLHRLVYIANVLAFVGGGLYLALSIYFAFTQRSIIDEGLYLYKGYLFASGTYHPFQEYGPRTEYGPFSYLIPGIIQLVFGPGLRNGRYFAICVGILALLGLWVVARRLVGPWWAAVAVWAAALNPAVIHFYSSGVAHGTVICLLMWILVLSIGEKRPIWQLLVSVFLATFLIFVRQNMAPVLPVLLIYIFWQNGLRKFLFAVLTAVVSFLGFQVMFWPGSLLLWVPWLPERLTPFLNAWRPPLNSQPKLDFQANASARWMGLLEGFRFHFVSLTGSLAALFAWPRITNWKEKWKYRSAMFLLILFFVLLVIHTWVGLGNKVANNNSAFSVNPFLCFFTWLGILVVISTIPVIKIRVSFWQQIIMSLLILAVSSGVGYGGYTIIGNVLLNIKVPRLKNLFTTGHLLPATVPLWDYLSTKLGLDILTLKLYVSGVAGLIAGLLFLIIGFILWAKLRRKIPVSFSLITIAFFLICGTLLSPTPVLGGGFTQWDCTGNVIETYEQTGHQLAEIIPPGSTVYWDGGNAVAALLYVSDIQIHPQQLDGSWNYWIGGDSDTMARLSLWNDALARQWREQSNVFIIQQFYFSSDWQAYLNSSQFDEVPVGNAPLNCTSDTYFRVFIRK